MALPVSLIPHNLVPGECGLFTCLLGFAILETISVFSDLLSCALSLLCDGTGSFTYACVFLPDWIFLSDFLIHLLPTQNLK